MIRLFASTAMAALALPLTAVAQTTPGQINDPSTYQGSMANQAQEQASAAAQEAANQQMQHSLDQNYAAYAPQGGGGALGGGGAPPVKQLPLLPVSKNPLIGKWQMGATKPVDLNGMEVLPGDPIDPQRGLRRWLRVDLRQGPHRLHAEPAELGRARWSRGNPQSRRVSRRQGQRRRHPARFRPAAGLRPDQQRPRRRRLPGLHPEPGDARQRTRRAAQGRGLDRRARSIRAGDRVCARDRRQWPAPIRPAERDVELQHRDFESRLPDAVHLDPGLCGHREPRCGPGQGRL